MLLSRRGFLRPGTRHSLNFTAARSSATAVPGSLRKTSCRCPYCKRASSIWGCQSGSQRENEDSLARHWAGRARTSGVVALAAIRRVPSALLRRGPLALGRLMGATKETTPPQEAGTWG